ncbi:hypothetical protein LCGC14_3130050 [marine sediment metagenome]|uniref:Resolvase/invertase-type recombinase catalytic domain-containing protein n=1 Tax=marine sediment metagenome TaxID=412755 RepID=A0A0F8W000_9ZZZZ
MTKLKLFVYMRVSTKKQMKDGTMENQVRSINRFMKYNNDKFMRVNLFKDEGISAFSYRPAYEKMIKKLFNNEADGIIIQRLDRVGRSVKQLSELMVRFNNNNKTFIATEQNINTSTIEGKLFFHILASIAEFNAALIKERMKEGLERWLEKEVNVIGRHKKIQDPKIIRKIKKLYEENKLGISAISKFLKGEEPPINISAGTVRNILLREKVKLRDIYHGKT